MKKTVALVLVFVATTCLAEPGFIRAEYHQQIAEEQLNSASDVNSAWLSENTSVVTEIEDIYTSPFPAYTTLSYAAYMYFEGGVVYGFKGQFVYFIHLKVDDKVLFEWQDDARWVRTSEIAFSDSGWHKIDLRCYTGYSSGWGGSPASFEYGGLWMRRGVDGEWSKLKDPGDGSVFRTDLQPGPTCGYEFTVVNSQATVIKAFDSTSKVVIIPEEIEGVPVTAIADGVFQSNTTVQKIVIPESVTSIGGSAFAGCLALTTCNIPSGVTAIPGSCFDGCTKLRRIVLPDGIKSIGDMAFENCSSLENVVFPVGLEMIGNDAFEGCSCLTTVELPDTVTSIGHDCFRECVNLETVRLPAGLKKISYCCFCNFWTGGKLRSINIPDTVTAIEQDAFYGCSMLQELVVPANVTSVGERAFNGVQRVVFLGKPPVGLQGAYIASIAYSKEYGELWASQWPIAQIGGFVKPNRPVVTMVSAHVRENDPTVLDVVYKVTSTKPTVKVRALAFEDGVRSFANVTRPETFIDGTAANIGDAVAANVEHTLSWKVSSDFKTDLAKMKFEVFAVEDGILPLELTTIPANGTNRAMELSWNLLTEAQVFDALLWLYADGDSGLTLADGVLKNGENKLAEGKTVIVQRSERKNWDGTGYYYKYFFDPQTYIFSKMGFSLLTGDELTYANAMTRFGLEPSGIRQYAYRWIEAE